MGSVQWQPREEQSRQETFLLKRLGRTRMLFAFLRLHRRLIFDDGFQLELEAMYRSSGAGKPPVPPALMAMAALLQSYSACSDAEAVELTVVDLRWQMVLDVLGAQAPVFSQGAFQAFRQRLIAADMDKRLLERTVEVARETKGYDPSKLPQSLRVAMDSSPLEGAGRVEDTINLLGHAARNVISCVAALLKWSASRVCEEAGIPALDALSVKRGLDINWNDNREKGEAIKTLTGQLASMEAFIKKHLANELKRAPLKDLMATLRLIVKQDLEPDPGGGGGVKIKQEVAAERRISVTDEEMRHGRKSKTKTINGYKRHIARDLDSKLVLACAVTPANRPEQEAAALLKQDIEEQAASISELHVDRGYIGSPIVREVLKDGGKLFCKPWSGSNSRHTELFAKSDFDFDMRAKTVTCPMGQVAHIKLGLVVMFARTVCAVCPARVLCTKARIEAGRTIDVSHDEDIQHRLRKQIATPIGRQRLRERVAVEHALAHIGQRQGVRARYRGLRNNNYDLRRAAAIQNLETTQRAKAA